MSIWVGDYYGPAGSSSGPTVTDLAPGPDRLASRVRPIRTLHDLVAHCLDSGDSQGDAVDRRRAYRSALFGFTQASTRHQWNTYDTSHVVTLNAPYDTGTISIDAAGVVTLAGGTWPAWAHEGSLVFDDNSFRIGTRDSDTQLTMSEFRSVSETPATWKLVHDRKLLPYDIRETIHLWNQTTRIEMEGVGASAMRMLRECQATHTGDPRALQLRSVRLIGRVRTEMAVHPYPSRTTHIQLAYNRHPFQPMHLIEVSSLSITANSVDAHESIGVNADVVGSILRVSPDGKIPGDAIGYGVTDHPPFLDEGEITEQASSTAFTVDSMADATAQAAVITDVLDIPYYAFTAAQLYAEAQMARIGKGDMQQYRALIQDADHELRYAMEQDVPALPRDTQFYLRAENITPLSDDYVQG